MPLFYIFAFQGYQNMEIQEFLEEFRSSENTKNSFCYGLGHHEPSSSFLFRYLISPNISVFLEGIGLSSIMSTNLGRRIKVSNDNSNTGFSFSMVGMIHCFADLNQKKIGFNKYRCEICGKVDCKKSIYYHIIEEHQEEISEELERQRKFLKDDKMYLKGMIGKLMFEGIVKKPKKQYYQIDNNNGNTIAPDLHIYDSDEESYEEDIDGFNEPDINDSPVGIKTDSPIEVYFDLKLSSSLTKFARKNDPSKNIKYDMPPNTLPQFNNLTAGEQLLLPIVDSYVQEHNENYHNLLDSFPEEEVKTKPKQNKRQKYPEMISYIENIPEQYREKIISNIAMQLISNYTVNYCNQTVRNTYQTKKKEIMKQIKEEKAKKQRDEEKQRLMAMRERKAEKINKITGNILESIIRVFIKSEIKEIYSIESESIAAENIQENNEDNSESEYNKVVVVSGFVLRRHLNSQFLLKTFGNLSFEIDSDGQPKIRFKCDGNRIQAVLFLSSIEEVRKALKINQVMIEYSTVYISRFENTNEPFELFTEQQILKSSTINSEVITKSCGKSSFIEMSPFCDFNMFYNK